jgi:hypothetical protein
MCGVNSQMVNYKKAEHKTQMVVMVMVMMMIIAQRYLTTYDKVQ